ncbi:MAG TPA: NUDIX domain-containing protein [Micromonosporaceae bacterium]
MIDYARRAARVLLVNADDRVLLLHYRFADEDSRAEHGWYTPGGGVDPGETLREAAVRELAEEIGLRIDELGPHVAFSEGQLDLHWVKGFVRDDYFLHRIAGHEVDVAGMFEYETKGLLGHAWWSIDELAATADLILPFGLAGLMRRLVADDIPPAPVQLPWSD